MHVDSNDQMSNMRSGGCVCVRELVSEYECQNLPLCVSSFCVVRYCLPVSCLCNKGLCWSLQQCKKSNCITLSERKLKPCSHEIYKKKQTYLFSLFQLQPQEISPPPTANLDRSNDKVYENVTGLVKAVIEMSNRIQPAAPEEYVPMVKVGFT